MIKKENTEITMPEHSTTDMSAIKESVENKSYRIKFQDLFDLTRSICHELSQPITILLGYSEMMLLNTEKNDPLYKKLSEINKQADKTDEIIRRMQKKIKYIAEESISGSEIIGKI